jgi:hypothetical protein
MPRPQKLRSKKAAVVALKRIVLARKRSAVAKSGHRFWMRYAATCNVDLPAESDKWTSSEQYAVYIRSVVSWRSAWRLIVQMTVLQLPNREYTLRSFPKAGPHSEHITVASRLNQPLSDTTFVIDDQYKATVWWRKPALTLRTASALLQARRLSDFTAVFGSIAQQPVTAIGFGLFPVNLVRNFNYVNLGRVRI